MDQFVANKLSEWQLSELTDSFKEQDIDEDAFLLLDEEIIRHLIPKVGTRVKFLKLHRELVIISRDLKGSRFSRGMAYVCFKCRRLIPGDVNSLFSHLRIVHNINGSSTYFECCEEGCNRKFSLIRSYRRHIKREHEKEQVLVQPANVPDQAANNHNDDEVVQPDEVEEVNDDAE